MAVAAVKKWRRCYGVINGISAGVASCWRDVWRNGVASFVLTTTIRRVSPPGVMMSLIACLFCLLSMPAFYTMRVMYEIMLKKRNNRSEK